MRALIATFLCVLAGSAVSQAQQAEAISGKVVAEAEQDRTLISKAGWLRGLHVLGTNLQTLEKPQIHAFLPAGAEVPLVCARITSMAGDYSAMVEFDIQANVNAGTQRMLTYDQQSDLALANTPETGGVVVERGPCEGDVPQAVGTPRDFYVNFWNQAGEPQLDGAQNATLVLLINVSRADSLQAQAVLLPSAPGGAPVSAAVPCSKINAPEALAYNFECRLLMSPDVIRGMHGHVIEFSYSRIYRGEPSAVRRANLHLGRPDR